MKLPVPGLPDAQIIDCYHQVLEGWPVANQQRYLMTRAGATFVVSCGPVNAPALVLLHGTLSNAASWMFDAERWSTRYRVHAVDLIGEPGLSAPTRLELNDDAHACWLDDILDGLGLSEAAFVGLSLGGFLALDYAIRRPQRTRALVLISPSGIGRQRPFLLKAIPYLLLGHWGQERLRRKVMGPNSSAPDPRAQALLRLLELIRAQVRPRALRIPLVSDAQLSTLRMPVLILLGGRDALLHTIEAAQRVHAHLPAAQVHFLPEAYHYIPGQRERVLDFLVQASGCRYD
ncbi:MAG: Carboxylesterase YbfK [Pseudomonas citronellolis]|nr:MAG: Carboxylesterase YbfK [Pseudomonas citronellolis]